MSNLSSWTAVITGSFQGLWLKFVNIIPEIVVALAVFIVGLFIAEALGRLITKLLEKLYLDKMLEKAGVLKVLDKVGFRMGISKLLGLLTMWFLIAVFLVASAEILHLGQISQFLNKVVAYIPNVIIAVVIMVIGIIVGNFVKSAIQQSAGAANIASAHFLAALGKWSILIFSLMAALVQLRVAASMIQTLFTGLVAMLALAGGLAFGLGGKEKARELLDKVSRK
ncbi:hypothetical protein KKA15_03010 [Patescibacteria group bacterium]|nr:hypothetical protein [Patescibacteria group bacterium]